MSLIKTSSGLSKYSGIRRMKHSSYYKCTFTNGKSIACSPNHPFMTYDGLVLAKDLTRRSEVYSDSGGVFLKSKKLIKQDIWLYDALNTHNNTYYTNGILSHNCDFIGSSNTLISGAKLSSMTWVPPIERMSSLAIYEQPRDGRIYMICADVAEGKDLDYSAFVVVDSTEAPYKVVARYYDNKVTPLLFPNIILHTANKYNRAYVMVETNSVGAQVVDILHNDLEYENIFATTNMGRGGQKLSSGFGKNSKFGVKMTNQIKLIGCSNLKGLLENDKILIEDFDTISELTSFVSTNTSFGAEEGCHDDLVMCLVLFAWLSVQPTFKEITDSDVRKRIFDEQVKNMNDQVLPFGYIEDGADRPETFVDSQGDVWESVGETFNFGFNGGKAIRSDFDDDF